MLLHQSNVAFTNITIFYAQGQCHHDHWWLLLLMYKHRSLSYCYISHYPQKLQMNVIQFWTQEMNRKWHILKWHLLFRWLPPLLNSTSYTVCQLFGKKQLYSVALVLQKYTYLTNHILPPFSTIATSPFWSHVCRWHHLEQHTNH